MDTPLPDTERQVLERYADAAQERESELCCAVQYDPKFLEAIPQEILDKDYGCGDPSRYVRQGDVVLDLGSGGGKICYIASQAVGPKGRVIGVDFNPAMLALAARHQPEAVANIGWDNVTFLYGKIQDLRTDYRAIDRRLEDSPVHTADEYLDLEEFRRQQAAQQPLVADASIDVILSNCVLNLVRTEEKAQLFHEMHRVLKPGGRAAVSDIVSDKTPTQAMRNDAELWSGCISGAFQEQDFLRAFEEAGFRDVEIEARDEEPWQTVDGIEFRSLTVTAHKLGPRAQSTQGPQRTKNCC